jgi:hypothetical protein
VVESDREELVFPDNLSQGAEVELTIHQLPTGQLVLQSMLLYPLMMYYIFLQLFLHLESSAWVVVVVEVEISKV